jgi:F0F1-type ATP synthase membrane subunit b/b'
MEKAKNLKYRAEARMEQLKKQEDEIISELDKLGVKPEALDDEIAKLKSEIEGLIKEANQLLPKDLLDKQDNHGR